MTPEAIAAIQPGRSRVFLRRLRQALTQATWKSHTATHQVLIERLALGLTEEIDVLEAELADLQQALAEAHEIRQFLTGQKTAPVRSHTEAGPGLRPSNADLVLEILRSLGGIQRAETVVEVMRHRYPGVGGATMRTQVYHILGHDERIERVGRGLYKARPLR